MVSDCRTVNTKILALIFVEYIGYDVAKVAIFFFL